MNETKLKLLRVGCGTTDIAHDNAQCMLGLVDRHGLKYSAHESDGGHSEYNSGITWPMS